MIHKRKNRIGEEKLNNQGCIMKIIQYENAHNIIVEFQDKYKAKIHTNYDNFLRGGVRNPYHCSICKVACIGNTKVKINNKDKKSYSVWNSMIHRCYDEKYNNIKQTYKNKFVCNEWLCFENFEKWFNNNYYEIKDETMHLDKDILFKGNKIYSPNTCVFVPSNINALITKPNRKDKITGVYKTRTNKYIAEYGDGHGGNIYIGTFETEDEAFYAYKKGKEQFIKETADKYKNKIPNKLYDALYNWTIEK